MSLTIPMAVRRTDPPGFAVCAAIIAALTLVRLIGLQLSTVDLYFDESQYWAWSRDLAFGYFSKPPMLAWIIGGFDSVCGSGEACVRAASPLIHFGTSLLVYAIAREAYDAQVAFWSALTFALATGITFSSRIISTDVPLLFFWALALLATLKLLRTPRLAWALTLGVALGLGFLSKYAMIYFAACMALAALVDRDARALLRRKEVWIAIALATLIVLPNFVWNAANGFLTFRHTGDNIQGTGFRLNPTGSLAFLASQFAVLGPIAFGAFLLAFWRAATRGVERADRLMLAFALPPLALVAALAFVRGGANANWAAPAFVSAAIVAAALIVRGAHWRWLSAAFAFGFAVQTTLLATDALAERLSLPALGRRADVYQRTLGWQALAERGAWIARETGARTVVAERRHDVASLLYYLRGQGLDVRAWGRGGSPDNHFELSHPLDESAPEPILLVTTCPFTQRFFAQFADAAIVQPFTARTGPTTSRGYYAIKLSGRIGPISALRPCSPF